MTEGQTITIELSKSDIGQIMMLCGAMLELMEIRDKTNIVRIQEIEKRMQEVLLKPLQSGL